MGRVYWVLQMATMGENIQQNWTGMDRWASQSLNESKVDPELHESLLVSLIIRVLSRMA